VYYSSFYNGEVEFHMMSEFLPPDRRRYITYNSNPYLHVGDH